MVRRKKPPPPKHEIFLFELSTGEPDYSLSLPNPRFGAEFTSKPSQKATTRDGASCTMIAKTVTPSRGSST